MEVGKEGKPMEWRSDGSGLTVPVSYPPTPRSVTLLFGSGGDGMGREW